MKLGCRSPNQCLITAKRGALGCSSKGSREGLSNDICWWFCSSPAALLKETSVQMLQVFLL